MLLGSQPVRLDVTVPVPAPALLTVMVEFGSTLANSRPGIEIVDRDQTLSILKGCFFIRFLCRRTRF